MMHHIETIKVFLVVLLVNTIENLVLLFFFKVPMSRHTILGSLIFAALVTLVLGKLNIGGEDG